MRAEIRDEYKGFEQPFGDPVKHPHDLLELMYKVTEPGYVFVYVSNESESVFEVYFDDLGINHQKTPIIQSEDYYPFGLSLPGTAFRHDNPSYPGMVTTNGLGKKDLGFRQYDPALGRFDSVDPLAELYLDLSSYQFTGNNPINNVEVLGMNFITDLFRWVGNLFSKIRTEKRMTNGVEQNVWTGNKNKKPGRHAAKAWRPKRSEQKRGPQVAKNNSKSKNKDASTNSDESEPPVVAVFATLVNKSQNKLPGLHENVTPTRTPGAAFGANSLTQGMSSQTEVNTVVSDSYRYASTNLKPSDLRQYLYSRHSPAEARMLYARALVGRTDGLPEKEKLVTNLNVRETEAANAYPQQNPPPISTPAQALAVIPADGTLEESDHFTNVDPDVFLDQLRERVSEGGHEKTNQGDGTNFCWASAIAKYLYKNNPKGMAKAMIGLYKTGKFEYENNNGGMKVPEASEEARDAVGSEIFDINQNLEEGKVIIDLDQMLFMTLADEYNTGWAAYINYLNQDYNPGDQNTLWASTPLAKTVQILEDFGYELEVTGSDVGGWVDTGTNKINAVKEALETKDVILYVHSGAFKKGENVTPTATHYVHVYSIEQIGDEYVISYWDYGDPKTTTLTALQFDNAVFGMIEIQKP